MSIFMDPRTTAYDRLRRRHKLARLHLDGKYLDGVYEITVGCFAFDVYVTFREQKACFIDPYVDQIARLSIPAFEVYQPVFKGHTYVEHPTACTVPHHPSSC